MAEELASDSVFLRMPVTRIDQPQHGRVIVSVPTTLYHKITFLYAQTALESAENFIICLGSVPNNRQQDCNGLGNTTASPGSFVHPEVPSQLEPVLALALLSMYECCQRNNWPKMRVRANQALTAAMDLLLHIMNAESAQSLHGHRRAWWITVSNIFKLDSRNSIDLTYINSIDVSCISVVDYE